MILVALGGMAATMMLLVSAAIKFGWLGAVHVIFTAIAVGIWFAAANIAAGDDSDDTYTDDERKEE